VCTISFVLHFVSRPWIITTSGFCCCYHVYKDTSSSKLRLTVAYELFSCNMYRYENIIYQVIELIYGTVWEGSEIIIGFYCLKPVFELLFPCASSQCIELIKKKSHSIHIFWSLNMTVPLYDWCLTSNMILHSLHIFFPF